jgi:hypothetical protein
MLNFRTSYIQAMNQQAPQMFRELRKTGKLEAFADQKAEEARQLFSLLTKDAETLPGTGVLRDPNVEREATEQVYETLITFPPQGEEADAA